MNQVLGIHHIVRHISKNGQQNMSFVRVIIIFLFFYWIVCFLFLFYYVIFSTKNNYSFQVFPVHSLLNRYRVFPSPNETSDRILEQLNLTRVHGNHKKLILLWSRFDEISKAKIRLQGSDWMLYNCPVKQCEFMTDRSQAPVVDVIMTKKGDAQLYNSAYGHTRKPDQVLVWYELESPKNSVLPSKVKINWTATYRHDSTITAPYNKFVPHVTYERNTENYAQGKSKMVAWFVSNCGTSNRRHKYAEELSKYIGVDIYGHCGKNKCSKAKDSACQAKLRRDYKFYLSFENSNCRDYITEKFFEKGLKNNIVPIVMGAPVEDYRALAPPHSFIHVDDYESTRHLADYLKRLDQNDTLYNEYLQWKGAGDFIDTKFWCRICSLIHEAHATGARMWYENLRVWWEGDQVCTSRDDYNVWDSWKNKKTSGFTYDGIVEFVMSLTL